MNVIGFLYYTCMFTCFTWLNCLIHLKLKYSVFLVDKMSYLIKQLLFI